MRKLLIRGVGQALRHGPLGERTIDSPVCRKSARQNRRVFHNKNSEKHRHYQENTSVNVVYNYLLSRTS